ncbi:glycosyltransferase [Nevskia soli]|uniref:glycosyltransferase n=1 Tax=Nevskia soli TaxID=418856 RepID=UPI0004A72AB2|nr:glycosyltransferase [Nevskia soli]
MHKGGIGRFIYNMVNHPWNHPVEFTILLYGHNFENATDKLKDTLHRHFGKKARFILLADVFKRNPVPFDIHSHNTFDEYARESYYLYFALKHLLATGRIKPDYIEFIDIFGPAFFSVQSKYGEDVFKGIEIGVRLHSTNSIITHHELYGTSQTSWHAKIHDIERKALLDADYVVGHLPEIASENLNFYKFPADWMSRTVVNFPPVVIDKEVERETHETEVGEVPVVAFSSRICPFKQPHLFIDAATILLDRGVKAQFVIASYGWDHEYNQKIKNRVPSRHRDSFSFADDLTEEARLRLLRAAITVIPSSYESFCFFAYESLLRRQRVILNRDCVAFGQNDFWKDGENCLLFEGSAGALASSIERAIEWTPVSYEIPRVGTPYWEKTGGIPRRVASIPAVQELPKSPVPSLAIIAFEPFGVTNVLGRPSLDLNRLCKIDMYFSDREAPERSILPFQWPEGPKIVQWILRELDNDYISINPSRSVIQEEFLRFALQVLQSRPEIDGVVPQYADLAGNLTRGLVGGDLASAAAIDIAKTIPLGAVFRREFFEKFSPFVEDGEHWYYMLASKAVLSGDARFIAAPNHGYTLFGTTPDTNLDQRMASGLHITLAPVFAEKFGRPLSECHVHQHFSESEQLRILIEHKQSAEQMAIERLRTIHERDRTIAKLRNRTFAGLAKKLFLPAKKKKA